jgi:hypothetical protein
MARSSRAIRRDFPGPLLDALNGRAAHFSSPLSNSTRVWRPHKVRMARAKLPAKQIIRVLMNEA